MATEPMYIPEDGDASIKELILNTRGWILYLWSKWRVLLTAGIIGGALGLGYAFVKQPMYTATTTFVLEGGDGKSGLSRYAGMAAMVGIDLGGGAGGLFQGDNIIELYKSRTMLERTLLSQTHSDSNELLVDRYVDFNDLRQGWQESPELYGLDFKIDPVDLSRPLLRLRDSVLTEMVNTIREGLLTVSRPNEALSIIRVDVTSRDEVFSKAFNENLVRLVNDFYVQTKTKKSTDNIAILEAKVDSVRGVMSSAIYSAARTSDATPNLNPTRQVQRTAPVQEAQFSAEANKAILSQLLQNLELTKMTLLQEEPLIQIVDQPVYPLTTDRLGKAAAIIIGGFILGFLTVLALIVVKVYRDVMHEDEDDNHIASQHIRRKASRSVK